MVWKESKGIEKEIILYIHRKPKPISDISKHLNKPIQTISKTVERMSKSSIVEKRQDYLKDARKSLILINFRRIRIEKTHTFYLKYYFLIFFFLIVSAIISYIMRTFNFLLGSILISLPVFLLMLYEVYVKEDETIVYKNPKTEKNSTEKKVDNVD